MDQTTIDTLSKGLCFAMLALLAITVLVRLHQGWTWTDFRQNMKGGAQPALVQRRMERNHQRQRQELWKSAEVDRMQRQAAAKYRRWEAENAPTEEIPVVIISE